MRRSETAAARIHAVVLVSKLHKPALRALAYARASRPATLEAVTVERRPDRDRGTAGRVGRARHPGAAARPRLPVPRGHASGGRLRQGQDGRTALETSSTSTSPSTSSDVGGRPCCTTRARCASRPGSGSLRGSWSSRCPTSFDRRSWPPTAPRRSGQGRPGAVSPAHKTPNARWRRRLEP